MELITPGLRHIPDYLAALRRGWSPDTTRPGPDLDEIARATREPGTLIALLNERQPRGRTVRLTDGTDVPRLPGITRWMWDGTLAGSINLRWQPGSTDLPPTCLGHVGFSVVPWKRQRGYATQALGDILPLAAAEGLAFVDVTTDVDNVASQRVIEANGGVFVRRFTKQVANGGGLALLFRIRLDE